MTAVSVVVGAVAFVIVVAAVAKVVAGVVGVAPKVSLYCKPVSKVVKYCSALLLAKEDFDCSRILWLDRRRRLKK